MSSAPGYAPSAAGEADPMPASQRRCPLCGSTRLRAILRQNGVPVLCNVLWPTAEAALRAPKGDVELAFCERCGAIHNTAFDPSVVDYHPGYENSLHFSPTFQEFAEGLARRLIGRYGLEGGTVLEIGSGKGEFLSLLCRNGMARGIGYDPSHGREAEPSGPITFVPERYPERPSSVTADLVCCRHVLEHLARPADLLAQLRRAIGGRRDTVVYVEVPDGAHLVRELAVWDAIYEHPWHFTAPALRRLFSREGFTVLELGTSFGGQFLYVEARPDTAPLPGEPDEADEAEVASLGASADRLDESYRHTRSRWSRELADHLSRGHRLAVWGVGSKGTTFLNVVAGGDRVGCVVDVNRRKHGRHVPGTGQRVAPPSELRSYRPDVVLVMNPLYTDEVRGTMRELGVTAQVVAVTAGGTPTAQLGGAASR